MNSKVLNRSVAIASVVLLSLMFASSSVYSAENFRIESISPNPALPGDTIMLTGVGFRPDSILMLGSTPREIEFVSSSQIEFELPAGIQCSTYSIQVENPAISTGSAVIPFSKSNIRELSMSCGPGSREIPAALALERIEPARGPVGSLVRVIGSSFESPQTRILFDNKLITPEISSSTEMRFSVPETSCGQHTIRIQKALTGGPRVIADNTLTFEVLCGEIIRKPGGQILNIEVFDANNDCLLQNSEIFEAMDAWVLRLLDDDVFFDVIDAWVTGRNICIRAMGQIQVLRTERQLILKSQDKDISIFKADVFDLNGKALAQITSGGVSSQLNWNMRDSNNVRVANGVYLINIIRITTSGAIKREILKILVL